VPVLLFECRVDLHHEQEQALETQLQNAKQLVLDMPQKAAAADARKMQEDAEVAAAVNCLAGEAPPVAAPPPILIGGQGRGFNTQWGVGVGVLSAVNARIGCQPTAEVGVCRGLRERWGRGCEGAWASCV
jgi:hypothetical protein